MHKPPRAWFAHKRIGYGSGLPIAWQGWLILAVYLAIVMLAPFILPLVATIPATMIATIVLVVICSKTTEGGWRWRDGS